MTLFKEKPNCCDEVLRIERLILEKRKKTLEEYTPPYGNLLELNTSRLILDSVGETILTDITKEILNLLETSSAIYEKNGDYACGIFSSGWCRFLDKSSRDLCETKDNKAALSSGKWLCHESCWTNTSKASIEKKQPVEITCNGGIKLYGIPIFVEEEVVGSINFGHGTPPQDDKTLETIAQKYKVDLSELKKLAKSYEPRPAFLVEILKDRLKTAAKLIGLLIERKKIENKLKEKVDELEEFNKLSVGREIKMIELKEEIAKLKGTTVQ